MNDVDAKIASLGDWRGERLAHLRRIILAADPAVTEDVKWRKPTNPLGVPTWSAGGIICTGETYKDKVKLTFMYGSRLPDPNGLFNASLDGVRRAIDFAADDAIDEAALTALIKTAVVMSSAKAKG